MQSSIVIVSAHMTFIAAAMLLDAITIHENKNAWIDDFLLNQKLSYVYQASLAKSGDERDGVPQYWHL